MRHLKNSQPIITEQVNDDYYNRIYRPLDIIYENSDVIFINKPSGMLSQKAKPEDVSLVEYLIAHLIHKGRS